MREKRRLKLVRRQAMLAQIAQREAVMSLAQSLDELSKSNALLARSEILARDYSGRVQGSDAAALAQFHHLAGGLARLAGEAAQAEADARQQADWQARNLARADNRLKQLEDHTANALRAMRRAQDARTEPSPVTPRSKLARKLHR